MYGMTTLLCLIHLSVLPICVDLWPNQDKHTFYEISWCGSSPSLLPRWYCFHLRSAYHPACVAVDLVSSITKEDQMVADVAEMMELDE